MRPIAPSADPARHRAEPHVRLAAQSLVGRRAGARTVQRLRGLLRHSSPRAWALPRAYLHAGACLRRIAAERRTRARTEGCPPARQALRQQLAIGSRLVGRAARCRGRDASPSSSVCNAAPAADRVRARAVSAAGTARCADPRRCARVGPTERRDRAHPRQRAAVGCGFAAAVLRAARLEARR